MGMLLGIAVLVVTTVANKLCILLDTDEHSLLPSSFVQSDQYCKKKKRKILIQFVVTLKEVKFMRSHFVSIHKGKL